MLSKNDIQAFLDRMARAYCAQDAQACAALFTENAQVHSPFGAPAVGRAAIEALHRDWVSEPSAKAFLILDHGSADTLAWCLCRFSEGDKTGDGTSLLVMEQQPDGAWLIRSCCLHGDPEPE
ncbi:MAG: nuclear transport factor 2 family protein [Roseobacter sp.]